MFWLVLPYDLLEDRSTVDVIIHSIFLFIHIKIKLIPSYRGSVL